MSFLKYMKGIRSLPNKEVLGEDGRVAGQSQTIASDRGHFAWESPILGHGVAVRRRLAHPLYVLAGKTTSPVVLLLLGFVLRSQNW